MASIEHRESLPKAMEIFDSYKVVDQDKDSDEESFHLPLLDLEDDINDKDLDTGKTEDELLNGSDDDDDGGDAVTKENCSDKVCLPVNKNNDEETDLPQEDNGMEKTATSDSSECNGVTDKKSEELNNEESPPKDKDETQSVTCNIAVLVQPKDKESTDVENVEDNPNADLDQSKDEQTEVKTTETETSVELEKEQINENGDKTSTVVELEDKEVTKSDRLQEVVDTTVPKQEDEKVSSSDELQKEETTLLDKPEENQIASVDKTLDAQEDVNMEKEEKTDNKSDSLQCEDLLDISLIRDVDEDDKAVADSFAQNSDKSDNDDQAEAENETSETDQDQENEDDAEHNNEIDVEENMSNQMNFEAEASNDKVVNGESDSAIEMDSNEVSGDTNELNNKTMEEEPPSDQPTEPIEILDLDKHMAEPKTLTSQPAPQSGKRSLPEDPSEPLYGSKKPKLSLPEMVETPTPQKTIKTLINFKEYMRSKSIKKLTLADVEQFCLQKICEYHLNCTPLGEQYQVNKRQEQMIDNLRKETQLLMKQVRDLEVVNKKLLNELRNQNGTKKPLVPLKITRSVGLQVKLSQSALDQNKRRYVISSSNNNNNNKATSPMSSVNKARNVSSVINSNKTTPRSMIRQGVSPGANRKPQSNPTTPVKTTPVKTASSPMSTNTPILSQVLQGAPRTVTNMKKTPPSSPIVPKSKEAGIIDLTDEDDKSGKANARLIGKPMQVNKVNFVQLQNNNRTKGPIAGTNPPRSMATLSPGVRLSTAPVKNGIALPASVVTSNATGTPQLMYVVQPSQLVTSTAAGGSAKAVLFNFQPNNGIITSALNSSTVSVIPTKPISSPVQLKTVPSPRKQHPAPLPPMPPVAMMPHLKPVLPKPQLTIRKTDTGIILQWRMPYNLDMYESIASYQLYAYQESNSPPSTDQWRKVGDVKALALPMACTLTQFADKNKYYFAVRSVDVHKRIGAFSDPEEISL